MSEPSKADFKKELIEFILNFSPIAFIFGFLFFVGIALDYSSKREYEQEIKLKRTKEQIEQIVRRSCNLERLVKEGEKLKKRESKLFPFTELCKPAKIRYEGKDYDLLLLYKVAGVEVKKIDHVILLKPTYIGKSLEKWDGELGRLTGKQIPLPTVEEILKDSSLVKNTKVIISDKPKIIK